jgi:hypothetical protein
VKSNDIFLRNCVPVEEADRALISADVSTPSSGNYEHRPRGTGYRLDTEVPQPAGAAFENGRRTVSSRAF